MSYEGYEQYLCANGHETHVDCTCDVLEKCPVCGAKMVWSNSVDLTNGSYYNDHNTGEETRIDGHVELEANKDCREVVGAKEEKLQALLDAVSKLQEASKALEAVQDVSTVTTYKIPEDEGRRI